MEKEFLKASRLIAWLVDGVGTHCIPFSLWRSVTVEWVVENYNVEMDYFTVNPKVKHLC